jgi:hypothetical protein
VSGLSFLESGLVPGGRCKGDWAVSAHQLIKLADFNSFNDKPKAPADNVVFGLPLNDIRLPNVTAF